MIANQVKIFATPEAYKLLEDAKEKETIRIFEALKLMVVDGNRRWSGYGFGDCPIGLTAHWKSSPDEPSVILLYKHHDSTPREDTGNLGSRMTEGCYYYDNLPELIESAIPISFD